MNLSQQEYDEIAAKLADIFRLRRSKEYSDRWVLDRGWGTKTNQGLVESFVEMAKRIVNDKGATL